MSHTPGPWIFECEDVGTYGSNFWLESEAGDEIICQSENEHQGVLIKGKYFVANARLLAAAPDLLEALCFLQGVSRGQAHEQFVEAMEMAGKAISKATGETG